MAASTIKVSSLLLLTAMLFAATLRPAIAFDIVKILQGNHDFVAFASMLESTKLSDNINSKKGITVLAVSNRDVMDKMMQRGTDMKTAMAKNILRLHVVMDYWPMEKLSSLAERSKYSTTLFETTGNAPGSTGFANVTKDRSKKIVVQNLGGNGSSNGFAYVVKSLYEEPYNLSVLQIFKCSVEYRPVLLPQIFPMLLMTSLDLDHMGQFDLIIERLRIFVQQFVWARNLCFLLCSEKLGNLKSSDRDEAHALLSSLKYSLPSGVPQGRQAPHACSSEGDEDTKPLGAKPYTDSHRSRLQRVRKPDEDTRARRCFPKLAKRFDFISPKGQLITESVQPKFCWQPKDRSKIPCCARIYACA